MSLEFMLQHPRLFQEIAHDTDACLALFESEKPALSNFVLTVSCLLLWPEEIAKAQTVPALEKTFAASHLLHRYLDDSNAKKLVWACDRFFSQRDAAAFSRARSDSAPSAAQQLITI